MDENVFAGRRWMNPNPLLALKHFTVPCSLTDVLTFLLGYLRFSTASSRTTKKLQV
jgi:hypothetical protein